MAGSESSDGPPAFDNTFDADDVEQRIYGVILQTREPATATVIADRADCDPKTARKYLSWFANLGIITRHDGHPATYERNDAYFKWRRINQLAANHSREELQQQVRTLTEKITRYEDAYDAATPADVNALAIAEANVDWSIDEIYSDLADWSTARQERERYERARQQRADTPDHNHASG